ncbi:extensin family protein [Neorhizobium sp. NPDC001467]|uniref:extensin-like domain-containing protein n=1 Tax=Neorhizobium sp. NPDC001467 TaxID=3390595 RepID=UPI003D057F1D
MKQILCVFACLPLALGAATPPLPPVAAVERTDVVPVNAFDRFMKDIGVRKQSSRSKPSERRRARPAKSRGTAPAAAATPAVVPVPLPKPGTKPDDNAAPTNQTEDRTPAAAEPPVTEAPQNEPPVPEAAPKAPVATGEAASSETMKVEDVPKPLPKPEIPAAEAENPEKGEEKPKGETPAVTDDPGKTAEPGKADRPETDEDKKQEEKADSPPPPPLKKEDPEELKACLADLAALGAKFETIPAITGEEPGCGIEQPIAVKEILPGVETGGAQMRCKTAKALASWMKDSVQPAMSVAMPGRKITGIVPGSTYACRLRNSASSGKVSEHARGNAIDVAAFRLDNGETFEMKPRQEDSTLEGAFQRAATAAACLYFSTVLSPGSDATHQDHLHLDVLDRTNGYRYCR